MKHVRFIKVENLIVLSQSRQISVNYIYIFSNWSQYQHSFKAYLDSQPTQKNSKIDLHAKGASFEKPIPRSLIESVLRLCATNFIDSMFVSKSQWEKIMGFSWPYWYFCPFRGALARTEFNFSLYLKAHIGAEYDPYFSHYVCAQ